MTPDGGSQAEANGGRGIRRLSLILAWACLGFAVVIPIGAVWYWSSATPEVLAARLGVPSLRDLEMWHRLVGALVTMLPGGLMVMGLLRVRRCFLAFAAGRFFAPAVVRGLRGFAGAALGSSLLSLVVTPLLSVILTLGHPPGQRQLAVQIGSDQLFVLFVAGTIWVVAWVMGQAARLADENAGFV